MTLHNTPTPTNLKSVFLTSSIERFTNLTSDVKPERYLGDKLSAAESTRLTDPMARDHWSFGAGYVTSTQCHTSPVRLT